MVLIKMKIIKNMGLQQLFIIINIVKMEEQNLLGCHIQLEYLLNISRISAESKDATFHHLSVSHDKLNTSEKERTRDQSYEDIMKQIHQTNLEKIRLIEQLESVKQSIFRDYLRPFQMQFKELNEINAKLRQEIGQSSNKYKRDDKSQRYSNRSPIKIKSSVKSYVDQNKKTNTKSRNRVSPNLLMKKDVKVAESTSNLGRSQIQSPRYHKKRQSQLTERKVEQNMGESLRSVIDEKYDDFNIKYSVSRNNLSEVEPQANIFVKLLENILCEEKEYQREKYGQLCHFSEIKPSKQTSNQVLFINSMEGEIKSYHEKLEMLSLVIKKYQAEMKQLNLNLSDADQWTKRLWQVKGRYIQMQAKCQELIPLRKQVSKKQEKLDKLKELHYKPQQQKSITSIETLIKLLINPAKAFPSGSKLYKVYLKEIKQFFKFDKQQQMKRTTKVMKVKQTIDSIREGRKKFNELINIYQARILKMEEKISKVKLHPLKR